MSHFGPNMNILELVFSSYHSPKVGLDCLTDSWGVPWVLVSPIGRTLWFALGLPSQAVGPHEVHHHRHPHPGHRHHHETPTWISIPACCISRTREAISKALIVCASAL